MAGAEVIRWLVRAAVGLVVAAPLAWLVYQRPEGGYGRWGEAGLYVLAALTAAVALLLSEVAVALLARAGADRATRPPVRALLVDDSPTDREPGSAWDVLAELGGKPHVVYVPCATGKSAWVLQLLRQVVTDEPLLVEGQDKARRISRSQTLSFSELAPSEDSNVSLVVKGISA